MKNRETKWETIRIRKSGKFYFSFRFFINVFHAFGIPGMWQGSSVNCDDKLDEIDWKSNRVAELGYDFLLF